MIYLSPEGQDKHRSQLQSVITNFFFFFLPICNLLGIEIPHIVGAAALIFGDVLQRYKHFTFVNDTINIPLKGHFVY